MALQVFREAVNNVIDMIREDKNSKLHSKRVEKINWNPIVQQAKLHSKRVENIQIYTRNEWKTFRSTLETSGFRFKRELGTVEVQVTHLESYYFQVLEAYSRIGLLPR